MTEQEIQKIIDEERTRKYARQLDDSVSKKEFLDTFKNVIKQILKVEQDLIKKNTDFLLYLKNQFTEFSNKLKSDNSAILYEIKNNVSETVKKEIETIKKTGMDAKEEVEEMVKDAKEEVEEITKITRQEIETNATTTKQDLLSQMPKLDDVYNNIGVLKDEIEEIKKLSEEVKNIKENIGKGGTTRVIAGASANSVQYADLTSQCDGATKTFAVPMHRHALMLVGTQFPILYRPVIDFTTGNKTLTLTDEVSAPETSQSLVFLYLK